MGRLWCEIDLIAGGPPCQGFSVQRIGADHDDRNDLIFEFARFVSEIKPRMFVMENVPGLLGKRGAEFAARFESILTDQGYAVRNVRINAAEFGLPQIRKRIYYYGWLPAGKVPPFSFPAPTHTEGQFHTVGGAIGDLPPAAALKELTSSTDDLLHRRTRLSALNVERIRLIPPGGGFVDLPVNMRVNCHKGGADKIGHRYVYGRLSADRPASTITARFDSFTRGKFAHPYEDRNITLREGARLQSFPDQFVFTGSQENIAALIGNAVPPVMASVVGAAIHNHLVGSSQNGAGGSDIDHEQFGLFEVHSG